MSYRSRYAEQYQRKGSAGDDYDTTLRNRFELAIYELEQTSLHEVQERYLPATNAVRYLDYACGTGRILSLFSGMFDQRVGMDTSEFQLETARKRLPSASLIRANLVDDQAAVPAEHFDFVTCFRLFLNLEPENREPVLQAIAAAMKQGGVLVVDNHMNRYSALGLMALFLRKVVGMPNKAVARPGQRGIISTMTAREFSRSLGNSGFEILEIRRFFVLPGAGRWIALPFSLLVRLERMLAEVPLLNRLAKNQVFVCRKT